MNKRIPNNRNGRETGLFIQYGTQGPKFSSPPFKPCVSKIGGNMNKAIMIILLLFTSACGHWEPIVDLKGSLSGENFQEDKIMCRAIIKDETSLLYGAWYDKELMQNCMSNRGHSILNKW